MRNLTVPQDKSREDYRLLFVAAPLVARTGVYNSAVETVLAARERGLPWSLLLGVSAAASGEQRGPHVSGLREFQLEPDGLAGIRRLRKEIRDEITRSQPDCIVSLVPQSDMAISALGLPWFAYLRGRPWPASGESNALKAAIWEFLERRALKRATGVWATTATLLGEVRGVNAEIVPPGIALQGPQALKARHQSHHIVWAARFHHDKNPKLFLEALARLPSTKGSMFGTGPLEADCREGAPENIDVVGWREHGDLWNDATVYVGTSRREAFGRSAVEAAMNGVPVVLSNAFGAAPFIYTDAELKTRLVLDIDDVSAWIKALRDLTTDESFYRRVANHVFENSKKLTVEHSVEQIRRAIDF